MNQADNYTNAVNEFNTLIQELNNILIECKKKMSNLSVMLQIGDTQLSMSFATKHLTTNIDGILKKVNDELRELIVSYVEQQCIENNTFNKKNPLSLIVSNN